MKEQENTERKRYWNEDYVNYWKARVEEANNHQIQSSNMVSGDSKTSTDQFYFDAIRLLNVTSTDKVLELACGFGRSLNSLCQIALDVAAVDISEQMIDMAMRTCQEKNISFHVAPSENLPFVKESFDVIICFAAFDAMYQTEALIEINRVCKKGARVLLTGKNDNYYDDDKAALAAEIGARSKNHPNYFTDVKLLVREIKKFGFCVSVQKYYLRRGDVAAGRACEEMPEKFYEYLFVLNKITDNKVSEDLMISDKMSKTFARQNSLS